MRIEILTIGDELLSGDVLDSNKQWLSERCWENGLIVEFHTGVRDDEAAIRDALERAVLRADAILCTGGLGPTADDFTIEVAAKTFGEPMVEDGAVVAYLTERYAKRGLELSANNRKQALIPRGATAFVNASGTAPGVCASWRGKFFYFMPGVPREMKHLFETFMLPHLLAHRGDPVHYESVMLKTFGETEAGLDRALSDLFHDRVAIGNVRVGFRVAFPEIFIKLSAWDADAVKAQAELARVRAAVEARIGKFVYAVGREATMEGEVVRRLTALSKTVALAESCTGGFIANKMTNVSGSSAVFRGSVVAYANEVKERMLGVPADVLRTHGAVSAACAEAMVRGVAKLTGADFCAAVTGIAGPEGGTPDKPVGTVHVATLCDGELRNKEYRFPLSRDMFKAFVAGLVMRRFLRAAKVKFGSAT